MKLFVKILLLTLLTQPFLASYAEEIPKPSYFDKRIRTAVYNADQVYRVAAKIGYASYLQFWEGEKLESYFTGDASGWDVGSNGSIVAFKPTVKNPTTNFVIITNKGLVYNVLFDLKTRKTQGHIIGLRFQYPNEKREKVLKEKEEKREEWKKKKKREQLDNLALKAKYLDFNERKKIIAFNERKRKREEAEHIKTLQAKALARAELTKERRRKEVERINKERKAERKKAELDPNKQPYKNYKYVAAGDDNLRPTVMFDNGRFTFMRFREGGEWPAVFRVRKGKEYLVNSTVREGGWLVLPRLSSAWRIRLDEDKLCIKKQG